MLLDAPGPDVHLSRQVLRELAHGGDWIASWHSAFVAGVVAVLLVGVALVARHRRWRSWPWWTTSGVATVLALALGLNAFVGYVPNVQALQTTLAGWGLAPPPHLAHGKAQEAQAAPGMGAVTAYQDPVAADLRMPSDRYTWVYTPPGYAEDTTTRYPVVILIHGSPGASGDWFAAGNAPHTMNVLLAHQLVEPMIVVSTDVNGITTRDTECLNSTRGGSQIETYLTSSLVPWLDRTFRTMPGAAHRAIGGFSSGGFCALDQGLRHSHLFGTILAIEGYPTPGKGGDSQLATEAQRHVHDVTEYVRTAKLDPAQHVFIAVEANRRVPEADSLRTIADQLHGRGLDVALDVVRGVGHTWTAARVVLPYALVWASSRLTTEGAS